MEILKKIKDTSSEMLSALAQTESHHNPDKIITPGMPELLRSVAAQTAVLLENRVLPLASGTKVSVFGRVQLDWFATGYGSGGDVNTPYIVNLLDGLRNCEDIHVNDGIAEITYIANTKKVFLLEGRVAKYRHNVYGINATRAATNPGN